MNGRADAIFFTDAAQWRAWLEANHDSATEIWMGLNAKHVSPRGLTWGEAVPEALCFGWIDSKSEGIDADTRRQRWTPRKPGSTWSLTNVAHVERLTAQGRMHPSGIAAFERRRADRTGTYSFEQDITDLDDARWQRLENNPAAAAFWAIATPGYKKAVAHWIVSAKQETTRDKRLAELIEDCAAGRLVKFQRYGTPPAWVARAAAAAAGAQAAGAQAAGRMDS